MTLKQLLADRREVRSLFTALVLAKIYSDYAKVSEVEETLRAIVCEPLQIEPVERPGAPELTRVLQTIFENRFRTISSFDNPGEAFVGLGIWADYAPAIKQRIVDLVGPLDLASCIANERA